MFARHPAEHENVAPTFLTRPLPAIPEGKVLSRHPALASIPLAGGKLTLRVGSHKGKGVDHLYAWYSNYGNN